MQYFGIILLMGLAWLGTVLLCPLIALHAWRRSVRERRWATEVAEDLVVLLRKGWLDRARSRLQESPGILGAHLQRIGLWPGEPGFYASDQAASEIECAAVGCLRWHDRLLTISLFVGAAGMLALDKVLQFVASLLGATFALACTPTALIVIVPLAWLCRCRVRLLSAELCSHLRRLQREVIACAPERRAD